MAETKKRPTSAQKIVKELQEIRAAVESIETQVEELKPKTGARKAWQLFTQGIVRGVAFAFGTTVIAGLILFGFYRVLNSETIQNWISDTVRTAVEQTIGNAVSETIGSVLEN